jgi:predicted RND superfamily exporter protein
MYTYLCKLFHHLHRRPGLVLLLAFLATLASLVPLKRLEISTSARDLLPEQFESVRLWERIGQKFGASGNLTAVVHSPDSALNREAIRFLAEHLESHPDVNFLEHRSEAAFYQAHKLLYISLKDLQEAERRVDEGLWIAKEKHNPLLLDLLDEEEKEDAFEATSFQDLEKKYFSRLQDHLGTADGSTMVLRLYPHFDISDIARCRAFLKDVRTVVSQYREMKGQPDSATSPEILFTGDLMRSVQNEGRLYSSILDSGKRSLYLTALLLLLYFIRIPFGTLLAAIPLGFAVLWTLALTSAWVGHLSLVSAPLSLLLVGIGLEAAVQLLARYREERLKNFSASVAFETIILETGPAITTGVLVSAAAFLTLLITDFRGFSEFGLMAGIGLLCTLVAVLVVFPCLLILAEPWGLLPALGSRIYNFNLFQSRPYPRWRWHLLAVGILTVLCAHRGPQLDFQFNVDRLTYPNRNFRADSLLQASKEAISTPAVVLAGTHEEAEEAAHALRSRMAVDTLTPTIHEVTAMTDLLPADQDEKLAILSRLRRKVTPDLIEKAKEPLKSNLEKLREGWGVRKLTVDDLPANFKKKFLGRDTVSGSFVFVFPSVDLRQGWNTIAFAEDVRNIPAPAASSDSVGKVFQASGAPVVQADLLALLVPDSRKALGLALLTIFLLVLLDTKSLRGTAVLILPLLFSLLWTLGLLKVLGIKHSGYNLLAFPAMLAYGIINGVHFYHRYLEEGRGSVPFVLRRTGETTAVATLVGMAGFVGMAFSDHRGLASLGQTALIGLFMSLVAPLLIMPLIIGWLEEKVPVEESPPPKLP